ncbi:unnamed protein product [Wuchereria bancrofti]|uniref:Uncharacterized protein n=1 Tax=Wuchereria bancrofti TaxID=6293 RepID=A0A3P7DDF1_WUCBA|nr:unnamed protein product [Wuchereria bancrofti]
MKDKTQNQINIIYPYKTKYGGWSFDDEEVGLQGEPFVSGIPQIIDSLIGADTEQFACLISKDPIPNYTGCLVKQDHSGDGWYVLEGIGMVDEKLKITNGCWVTYKHPQHSKHIELSIHKVLNTKYSNYKPYKVYFDTGWGVSEGCKVIIAHFPLNGNPVLEGVPLLPEFVERKYQWIDDFIADCKLKDEHTINVAKLCLRAGYNKALQTKKFSEEDLRKAIRDSVYTIDPQLLGSSEFVKEENRIIQSLSQQQIPIAFEAEIVHLPIDSSAILLFLAFIGVFIWLTCRMTAKSKKDWETLYYLEKKAGEVSTKEEIEVAGEIKQGDIVQNEHGIATVYEGEAEYHNKHNSRKVKLFLCSRDIQVGDKVLWEKQTYALGERYEEYVGKIYELKEPIGLGLGMIILKDYYPKKSFEECRAIIVNMLKRHNRERTEEQINENTRMNVETSGDLHLKVGYNISENDVIKVIGQISPEATWVKEGDDKQDKNQFWVICGLQLLSGVARGYEQVVVNHYYKFKAVHPNANDNYFDPTISWKHKYKNNDPSQGEAYFGSTTVFAWTTDFKHLMDVTSDIPNYVSITLPLTIKHEIGLHERLGLITAKSQGWDYIKKTAYIIPQHLYFVSNDEIKEGTGKFDWSGENKENCDVCQGVGKLLNGLPQPSSTFIEEYIKAYNQGKKIEWVNIEYENDYHCDVCNRIATRLKDDDDDNKFQLLTNFEFLNPLSSRYTTFVGVQTGPVNGTKAIVLLNTPQGDILASDNNNEFKFENTTLEVGDTVKVTHKVPDFHLGWKAAWNTDMDKLIVHVTPSTVHITPVEHVTTIHVSTPVQEHTVTSSHITESEHVNNTYKPVSSIREEDIHYNTNVNYYYLLFNRHTNKSFGSGFHSAKSPDLVIEDIKCFNTYLYKCIIPKASFCEKHKHYQPLPPTPECKKGCYGEWTEEMEINEEFGKYMKVQKKNLMNIILILVLMEEYKRQQIIKWWNELSSTYKDYLCETNRELIGYGRSWGELVGWEIEKLWETRGKIDKEIVDDLTVQKTPKTNNKHLTVTIYAQLMATDSEYYDIEWRKIRDKVMEEYGLGEDDMENDSTEDEVNRETDNRFFDKFDLGFGNNDKIQTRQTLLLDLEVIDNTVTDEQIEQIEQFDNKLVDKIEIKLKPTSKVKHKDCHDFSDIDPETIEEDIVEKRIVCGVMGNGVKSTSGPLLRVFAEECVKLGWIYNSGFSRTNIEAACTPTPSSYGMGTNFILPEQWNEALQYAKEYFEERKVKPIVVELSEKYEAYIDTVRKEVRVGCQTIPFEKVLEVAKHLAGNKSFEKNVGPLSSDTFRITPPANGKIRAKTESNCGPGDSGYVELVLSGLPVHFSYFNVEKVDGHNFVVRFIASSTDGEDRAVYNYDRNTSPFKNQKYAEMLRRGLRNGKIKRIEKKVIGCKARVSQPATQIWDYVVEAKSSKEAIKKVMDGKLKCNEYYVESDIGGREIEDVTDEE